MPTQTDTARSTEIPKVIHQIWWQGEDHIPPKHLAWRQTWIDNHPDWTFRLWDSQTMTDFVTTHEPEMANEFANWPRDIFRADAFRYILLKHAGGVYVDLDIENLKPIDTWVDGSEILLSRTTGYNNCLLGGRPQHDLWVKLVDAIPRAAQEGQEYSGTHTGPSFLNEIIKLHGFDTKPEFRVAPSWVFEPLAPYLTEDGQIMPGKITSETFAIHHERLDWMSWHRKALSVLTAWTIMPLFRMFLNAKQKGQKPG